MGPRQPSPPAPPRRGRALSVLGAGPLLGFVSKEALSKERLGSALPATVCSLFPEGSYGVRSSQLSEFTVIYVCPSSLGAHWSGVPAFLTPGCRPGGGKGERRLPPPLLCRGWGLSLRASGSHSRTLCGPRLRCKAHCASRKSHRLSVGN